MEGRTTIKIKQVTPDFQTKEGTKQTTVIAIFGTIAAAAIVNGNVLKIFHDQALRDECKIGEGIFVGMKELYRKGIRVIIFYALTRNTLTATQVLNHGESVCMAWMNRQHRNSAS